MRLEPNTQRTGEVSAELDVGHPGSPPERPAPRRRWWKRVRMVLLIAESACAHSGHGLTAEIVSALVAVGDAVFG